MTIEEQSEIIEAYKMGEEIEIKTAYRDWTLLTFKYPIVYCFNFQDFDYRIKPKKLPKRFRANIGEKYYIIGIRGDVVELTECAETGVEDLLFAFGNYFQTREKAEKARDLIEECLNKFHEEND